MNTIALSQFKKNLMVCLSIVVGVILLSGVFMRAEAATTSYAYDSMSRLTKADYGNGLVIQYTYDAAGNRLTQVTTAIAPTIASQPQTQIVNSSGAVRFEVVANGTGPLNYQWYQGLSGDTSSPVIEARAQSYTTPLLASTTSYWVRVNNGAGSADSSTATALVIMPPVITTQPVSTTVNSGQTATFSIAVSGTSPAYQWYRGLTGVTANPIAGATGNLFVTTTLIASTSYWVRVTNDAGTLDSNTVTATVITPPSITTQPAPVIINSGGIATLTVVVSGTMPAFQWYEGAMGDTTHPVSGATEISFTTPPLTSATSYWVRASNAAGSADSNAAIVSITRYLLNTSGIHGAVTGAGTYDGMTRAIVSATPDRGYIFSSWTQDASGATNPLSMLMDAPKSVGAIFSQDMADTDSDGLSNYQEIVILGTDPNHTDTDSNGIMDALEDSDHDGLTNIAELNQFGSNPLLTDSNADGFLDAYSVCLVGSPYQLRIGNKITLDLKKLISAGQTIKMVGKLPTGLKFNAYTGLITGTLSGKPGTYQVSVQILQGKTVIRTVPFPITVLAFPSSLIGNFDCILEDTDSLPSGAFRLTITGANVWTATLESVGSAKKRSAKGSFVLAEGSPIAPITAVFPASSGASGVTVNLSIDGTNPALAGSYDGGTVRGFRLASGAEVPPVAKNCSLVVDAGPQDGITTPAGIGWLKGSWGKTGIGTFKGVLGDGTAATMTLRLSATGQAVLWAQPYTNKNSYIGGIVTLNNLGQPMNENEMLANGVWWSKGADAKTLSYPSGFPAMQVTLGIGKWSAPATASLLGASLGWRNDRMAAVTIDGAGLSNQDPQSTSPQLPTEFTLDDKFNLVVSAPAASMRVAWAGKAVKTDGSFTGKLTIPVGFSSTISSGTAAVSGVFLQDESWESVTGCGLIKVPASGVKGSFRTAGFVLEQ